MARSVPWLRTASDAVSWRQDQALSSTIYILRQTGPTGFLIKEEGETKKFKVLLGDPHNCTCPVFMKEKDLCKHICWVILRKFRVPRNNPVTWQLGLVEREINEILRGVLSQQAARPSPAARKYANVAAQMGRDPDNDQSVIKQKEITEEDVCPICQDELLSKHLPVTYCKFGCGNNVHIKCMKVWADHQKSSGKPIIECPFCREDFGPLTLLQQEMRNSSQRETRAERMNEHLGTTCKKCRVCPISGKCYKCCVCVDYNLCQACFNTPTHTDHNFQFRQKVSQRWRPAPSRSNMGLLPQAVVSNLMTRDISDDDYDLLLQLDNQSAQQLSDLTEETIKSFPMERVRPNHPLLAPGQQCRICLRGYEASQYVRRLPCQHKYHKDCIDDWLLHRHPTCPIDGTVFTNESVRQMKEVNLARLRLLRETSQQEAESRSHGHGNHRNQVVPNGNLTLEIPGVGIARMGTGSHGNSQPTSAARETRTVATGNHNSARNHGNGVDPTGLLIQNLRSFDRNHVNGVDHNPAVLNQRTSNPELRTPPRNSSSSTQNSSSIAHNASGLSLGEVLGVNIQPPSDFLSEDEQLQEMIINMIANDNRPQQTPSGGAAAPRHDNSYHNSLSPSESGLGFASSGSSAGSERRHSRYRSDPAINRLASEFSDSTLTIDDLGSQTSSSHSAETLPNGNIMFDPSANSRNQAKEALRRELGTDHHRQRVDRELRQPGRHRNGLAVGRIKQPVQSQGQQEIRDDHNDMNISGLAVHNNSSDNKTHRRRGQSMTSVKSHNGRDIQAQAPSIPIIRSDNGINLGVDGSAHHDQSYQPGSTLTGKPPTGDSNHGNHMHRQGRVKVRQTLRTTGTGRERSRSRERSDPNKTLTLGSLYIGHSPSSAIGFNSEFLLSANESRGSNSLRRGKSSSHNARSDQSGGRATIEANSHLNGEMSLSGSAVQIPHE